MPVEIVSGEYPEIVKRLILTPELWERIAEDGAMKEDLKLKPDWTYLLMTLGDEPIGFWSVHAVNNATIMVHCNVLEQYRAAHYPEFGRLIYEWFIDEAKPKYMNIVSEVPVIFESVCKYCEFFDMKLYGYLPASVWRCGELVDQKLYCISRNEIKEYLGGL